MARIYSRRKGKHGSKRPVSQSKNTWQRYTSKEIEMIIAKLAKEDKKSAEIGTILRDTYGVPDAQQLLNKRIGVVLKEKGIVSALPEDMNALIKKSVLIEKHLLTGKQDESARRGLIITKSKLLRLAKYYKRIGRLPETWKLG
ncbi:30S ribosomal protein S15 [Candidatus Woesearchaeota archaeon]|nr:30S ribosomal protein S15 [Candidatus Woesearchaeota archaeon]